MFPIITLFLGIIFACVALYASLFVLSFVVRIIGITVGALFTSIRYLI